MNNSKYSPVVIERSFRMVMEAKNEYSPQWATIESTAGKIGCTVEALRRCVVAVFFFKIFQPFNV